MMRKELLFIALFLSLICMASAAETDDELPPMEITVPVNGHINASETLWHNLTVGSNISSVSFALYWPNEGSDLEMALISPSGLLINQSAQMPTVYKRENMNAYYIVQEPEAGNWTAMIEAKNVSASGEDYTFFMAQILGNELIPENLTEPGTLSVDGGQNNTTS
jgi:hypothetical protein